MSPKVIRGLIQGQVLRKWENPYGIRVWSCLSNVFFLSSMFRRARILTTRGRHCSWQSPGEICQVRRICTACGRLPGSPLCQASSWIPEVCSTTACRALELCEECHLLPSFVSCWGPIRGHCPCKYKQYLSNYFISLSICCVDTMTKASIGEKVYWDLQFQRINPSAVMAGSMVSLRQEWCWSNSWMLLS